MNIQGWGFSPDPSYPNTFGYPAPYHQGPPPQVWNNNQVWNSRPPQQGWNNGTPPQFNNWNNNARPNQNNFGRSWQQPIYPPIPRPPKRPQLKVKHVPKQLIIKDVPIPPWRKPRFPPKPPPPPIVSKNKKKKEAKQIEKFQELEISASAEFNQTIKSIVSTMRARDLQDSSYKIHVDKIISVMDKFPSINPSFFLEHLPDTESIPIIRDNENKATKEIKMLKIFATIFKIKIQSFDQYKIKYLGNIFGDKFDSAFEQSKFHSAGDDTNLRILHALYFEVEHSKLELSSDRLFKFKEAYNIIKRQEMKPISFRGSPPPQTVFAEMPNIKIFRQTMSMLCRNPNMVKEDSEDLIKKMIKTFENSSQQNSRHEDKEFLKFLLCRADEEPEHVRIRLLKVLCGVVKKLKKVTNFTETDGSMIKKMLEVSEKNETFQDNRRFHDYYTIKHNLQRSLPEVYLEPFTKLLKSWAEKRNIIDHGIKEESSFTGNPVILEDSPHSIQPTIASDSSPLSEIDHISSLESKNTKKAIDPISFINGIQTPIDNENSHQTDPENPTEELGNIKGAVNKPKTSILPKLDINNWLQTCPNFSDNEIGLDSVQKVEQSFIQYSSSKDNGDEALIKVMQEKLRYFCSIGIAKLKTGNDNVDDDHTTLEVRDSFSSKNLPKSKPRTKSTVEKTKPSQNYDENEEDSKYALSNVVIKLKEIVLEENFPDAEYVNNLTSHSYITQRIRKVKGKSLQSFIHCAALYKKSSIPITQ